MRRISVSIAFAFLAASVMAGVSVSKRYRSVRNPEREVRKSTELIVLHTTEAPAKSSLRHTSERGLCHYCVTEDGRIYQIIDRNRVAFHAGLSMWNKKEEIDNISIGIECVGYHDKSMPKKQLESIRALVEELQGIYGIPDDRVVTHSQVAYGDKNKWQKRKHRGRKRCGMLFAMPSVRTRLNLGTRASFDPDVKAKRLVVADAHLNKALYGSLDTMVPFYGKGSVKGVDPTKSRIKPRAAGKGAKPVASKKAPAAAKPAAPKKAPPAAKPKTAAQLPKIPVSVSDLNAMGYVAIGSISRQKTPSHIAGKKWNSPDTYYSQGNRLTPGDKIDPHKVKEGMIVWRKSK